jgi:putative colanic acid biosynthesis glycosyltransferase
VLTIVTVCKNDLEGLKLTLNSLLIQECKDFHWLVIDSDSNDGTKDFLANLVVPFKSDFVSECDRGIYDGMNKALRIVKDGYLWFLNSGDECFDSLSTEKIFGATILGFDLIVFQVVAKSGKREKSISSAVRYYDTLSNMPVCHQGMIYSLSAFKVAGKFDCRYSITADHFHLLKLLKEKAKIFSIEENISFFDLDGVSNRNIFRSTIQMYKGSITVFPKDFLLSSFIFTWKIFKCSVILLLRQVGLR